MTDMDEANLVPGSRREHFLRYHDGRERRLLVVDQEVPYPDGMLIVSRTDPAGIITHANQAFIDMSGYTRDELIGQPHAILRHPDMPSAAFRDLWDTVSRGAKWQGYVKNLRKDGMHYWVFATAIPNVRDGRVVGYTSVRRKPSRTKIDECQALYARLRAEEMST
ncbi:putative PAS/PAC sensor protein [Leptothrix cholodnii SP-6]|uniref:Putative PAS/PAC sensor protein n=1 Tax=Leptothrix cholodnii (strain ATCC 51168 / LMG 8142 / SP-6) TaxID=395495 RepID=B1XZT8_LEPCP|nr:PAS domain-containing protein [Leptothrix cholodnii]ACB32934.1 putative PAS/PAC sensor protein [Leptothrix cholodnii SP-6]